MKLKTIFSICLFILLGLLTISILITQKWHPLAAMPNARTEMASTVVNHEIYIIGGYKHPDSLSLVEKYVPKLNQWVSLKDFPAKLDHPTSVSYGNYIYVMGGLDHAETGPASNKVFRYAINEDKWDEVSRLPKALGAMGAVLIGTKSIRLGGLIN